MTIKRIGDFTGPSRKTANKNDADSITFYKLLMTLGNLHSTVYSMYVMFGQEQLGNFHRDLSTKFISEANRVKNMHIKESEDDSN